MSTSTQQAPRSIIAQGALYFRYAGPFKTADRAELAIEDCYATGEIDLTDRAIIRNRAVYLLDPIAAI